MEDRLPVKICIIGSCFDLSQKLVRLNTDRLTNSKFFLTTGSEISEKRMKLKERFYRLILNVLSGKEFFVKLRPSSYRGSSGCLILFDKGDLASFKVVSNWYQDFRKTVSNSSVPIGIIGIQSEHEAVTTDEGKLLAEQLKVVYYETAINDKEQVNHILYNMLESIDQNV